MTDTTKTDSQNIDNCTMSNVHFVLEEVLFSQKRHELKVTFIIFIKKKSKLQEGETNMY